MSDSRSTYTGPDRRRGTPSTGLDRGRSSGLDGLRAVHWWSATRARRAAALAEQPVVAAAP